MQVQKTNLDIFKENLQHLKKEIESIKIIVKNYTAGNAESLDFLVRQLKGLMQGMVNLIRSYKELSKEEIKGLSKEDKLFMEGINDMLDKLRGFNLEVARQFIENPEAVIPLLTLNLILCFEDKSKLDKAIENSKDQTQTAGTINKEVVLVLSKDPEYNKLVNEFLNKTKKEKEVVLSGGTARIMLAKTEKQKEREQEKIRKEYEEFQKKMEELKDKNQLAYEQWKEEINKNKFWKRLYEYA